MSANDHAKVSDSGYANTYDNSQSQRSSGSSLSRNSNRSGSSGYCGGHPSNFGSSNEALPQPITKLTEKEQKKKKLKTLTSLENEHGESAQKCAGHQRDTGIYNHITSVNSEQVLKKSEEIGTVELVDATEPSTHNGDLKSTVLERGLGSQTSPLDETSSNINKEEFYMLVSLHDGLVLHSTNSFQTCLGYPKDSWLGNSFIDLLHLKDRSVFNAKLADVYRSGEREKAMDERNIGLFCRLKTYANDNFASENKKVENNYTNGSVNKKKHSQAPLYAPFHLNLGFKYFPDHDSNEEKSRILFLFIMAQPVLSAYKAPEETIISSIFSTRHTATCYLSHVDDDIVRYFGYLPQDMVGQSLFDYYHPEDLPFMKDVYETVVQLKGSSFRSKPYRFAVQNGGYVVLETEWSSFINPWGGKLEFVTGQHRILRGPMNPDVFQEPEKELHNSLATLSEEVLKESQIIQDEICTLLAETIQHPLDSDVPLFTEKRTELISFMENLINEIRGSKITAKLASIAADDRSFSEHDSVMLGEISPHHEYCDSKSSSETPPSYNQLNYNEKIARFFNSKPLGNAMYGSDEEMVNSILPSHNEAGNTNSNHTPTKSTANHDSGGSGSGENLSSASHNQTCFGSREDSINGNSNSTALGGFKLPTLTEGLLNQHNHDMEKLMVLKHKERRSSSKNNKMNKDNRIKAEEQSADQDKLLGKTRGTKRASTQNREEEFFKSSKYNDKTRKFERIPRTCTTGDKMNINQSQKDINMWPQMSPLPATQHYLRTSTTPHQTPRCSPFPQMVPLFYVPMPRIRDYTSNVQANNLIQMPQHIRPNPYSPYASSSMAGIVYPPVLGAATPAPMIYAPPMILKVPSVPAENPPPRPATSPVRREKTDQRKRPASQATSVKAEPGSIMAMSDSSKKPLSHGGRISSCLSVDGGNSSAVGVQNARNTARNSPIESSIEDSSDSSFYGSFLNTSSGSSCNPNPMGLGYSSEVPLRMPADPHKTYRSKSTPGLNLKTTAKQPSAPWMEGINVTMTPELMYQYQITPKPLDDVLKDDMKILRRYPQPLLVNDQLDQLYLDLELEGFEAKLILGDTSPSSDSNQASGTEDGIDVSTQRNNARSEMEHSKEAMIYEENAPMPPPIAV